MLEQMENRKNSPTTPVNCNFVVLKEVLDESTKICAGYSNCLNQLEEFKHQWVARHGEINDKTNQQVESANEQTNDKTIWKETNDSRKALGVEISDDIFSLLDNLDKNKEEVKKKLDKIEEVRNSGMDLLYKEQNQSLRKCLFWNPKKLSQDVQNVIIDQFQKRHLDIAFLVETNFEAGEKEGIKNSFNAKNLQICFVELEKMKITKKIEKAEEKNDKVLCAVVYRSYNASCKEKCVPICKGLFLVGNNDKYPSRVFIFAFHQYCYIVFHKASQPPVIHSNLFEQIIGNACIACDAKNVVLLGDFNYDFGVEGADKTHEVKWIQPNQSGEQEEKACKFRNWVFEETLNGKIVDGVLTCNEYLKVSTEVKAFQRTKHGYDIWPSYKRNTIPNGERIGDHNAVFFIFGPEDSFTLDIVGKELKEPSPTQSEEETRILRSDKEKPQPMCIIHQRNKDDLEAKLIKTTNLQKGETFLAKIPEKPAPKKDHFLYYRK